MLLYTFLDILVTLSEIVCFHVTIHCFCKSARFHPAVSSVLPLLIYGIVTFLLTWFTDLGAVKSFFLQLLVLLLINLFYRNALLKSIVILELHYMFIVFSEAAATLFTYIFYHGDIFVTVDGAAIFDWRVYAAVTILHLVFAGIAYGLLRHFAYTLQVKDIVVLTAGYLLLYCSAFVSMYVYLNLQTEYFITLDLITSALCVSFIMQFLYSKNVSALREQKQRDSVQIAKLRQQFSYYQEKQRDEERVRSLYHDMKNHLLVLEQQTQSADAKEMIESLRQEAAFYEDYVHTGNDILDIILKEKAKAAREKQMHFSVAVNLRGIDFIEPLDISTIFGNALDNALEASERLPDERRAILVKAGKIQNFLSVLIENNCSREPDLLRNGTAKDDFLHGFGLSNIKKAVEKYGGQLNTRNENGTFTLKILIPIPQTERLSP